MCKFEVLLDSFSLPRRLACSGYVGVNGEPTLDRLVILIIGRKSDRRQRPKNLK